MQPEPAGRAMARTSIEGEAFHHRALFYSALFHLDAGQQPQKGRDHFLRAALVMGFFAFEAYLNFALDVLDPTAFADGEAKRKNWREKFRALQKRAGHVLNKQRPPYALVRELGDFRDRMAHAKPETYTDSLRHPADEDLPMFRKGAGGRLSFQPEWAAQALAAVEELCTGLHRTILACQELTEDQRIRLGVEALRGALQQEERLTQLERAE